MSISQEIINVLDALCEKLGMVIDWTAENILPYFEMLCGKFVNYELATSVIWLIFGIVLAFLSKPLFKKGKEFYKKHEEKGGYSDWDIAGFFTYVGAFLFIFIGVSVVMTQLFDITTCLTFPEKILMEELQTIYNSMK